jgi:tRNA (guanine37-N1)-methyltransferase
VTLRIDVITLFPALFPGPLAESIPGRALERGLAELHAHDLRTWGIGRHRSVDDYPYGGGAGMVLRPEPIAAALDAVAPQGAEATRVLLDPGGRTFDQQLARDLAVRPWLVFVAPRYEGVDERVRSLFDLELSIGDYILSGGELPALVVIDAVLRLLPGAIDEASPVEESFSEALLEYPQYTRPAEFQGSTVPDVLVSGHHGEVAKWRRAKAIERTERNRPDLLGRYGDAMPDREADQPGGQAPPAILPDRQPKS